MSFKIACSASLHAILNDIQHFPPFSTTVYTYSHVLNIFTASNLQLKLYLWVHCRRNKILDTYSALIDNYACDWQVGLPLTECCFSRYLTHADAVWRLTSVHTTTCFQSIILLLALYCTRTSPCSAICHNVVLEVCAHITGVLFVDVRRQQVATLSGAAPCGKWFVVVRKMFCVMSPWCCP